MSFQCPGSAIDSSIRSVHSLGRVSRLTGAVVALSAGLIYAPSAGLPTARAQSTTVGDNQPVVAVYQSTSPSVVGISYIREHSSPSGRTIRSEVRASGFIIDQEGHIVTNAHVVRDAGLLDITLTDRATYGGRILATDLANDLAIITLDAPQEILSQLTSIPFGDSSTLQVGEPVLAIGNPFGLERSASLGIVSSLGRSRPGMQDRLINDMIQTDAAIHPGNSGGPLLNMNGEVVGINEQIATLGDGNTGVGFAIPINTVKQQLPELLAGIEPRHAWLGIGGTSLSPARAEALGVSVQRGVILRLVAEDGPAASGGLQAIQGGDVTTADVITALNSDPIRSLADIAIFVDRHHPGDSITVEFIRGGKQQTTRVTLGIWQPEESATAY